MTPLEPRLGPYRGVVRDITVDHADHGKFRLLLYCAYDAMGLIGTECNGIAVLNDTRRDVVCDEIGCEPFRAPTQKQWDLLKLFAQADWENFRTLVNMNSRCRYKL